MKTAIWRGLEPLVASRAVTGARVVPLLVGLWAGSSFGQVTTYQAQYSIPLDGGTGSARAYFATSGTALVNAGQAIQAFSTNGAETPTLGQVGTFTTFAVANNVTTGASSTTTLVAAFDIAPTGCPTVACVDIFFWDASGFILRGMAPTNALTATAMAIDATVSPIVIYYASASPSSSLYAQQVTVSPTNGAVSIGAQPTPVPVSFSVVGMAVDPAVALYLTDSSYILYAYALNLSAGAIVGQPPDYSQLAGISFHSSAGSSFLLGGGLAAGVYALNPSDAGVIATYKILAADAGPTTPSAASLSSNAGMMLVTEDPTSTVHANLHIVTPSVAPDGGTADAGSPDSGIPSIPGIAPGPGALPGSTNSCNCSTGGSAPVLLIFLLPLLVSRRRR